MAETCISGQFHIMSHGNLDLSKLRKGWHAYVVYKFEDETRAELNKITDIDAEHVVECNPTTRVGINSGQMVKLPMTTLLSSLPRRIGEI